MVTVIVPTVVCSICPTMVTARVLVPGPVIITTVGFLLGCMVYPRIVVVVVIAKAILDNISSRAASVELRAPES